MEESISLDNTINQNDSPEGGMGEQDKRGGGGWLANMVLKAAAED